MSPATPTIAQQPMSVMLSKNSEQVSTLWCLASGSEPLNYLWQMYQSSNDSWTRPSVRAVNITSPKLVFSKLTEEDEGIYRCIVFSDDDNVVSDNATITLFGELQYFVLCLQYVIDCHDNTHYSYWLAMYLCIVQLNR